MTALAVIAASLIYATLVSEPRWRPFSLALAFALRIAFPSYIGDLDGISVIPSLHVSAVLVFAYALVWQIRDRALRSVSPIRPLPMLCHIAYSIVVAGALLMSSVSFVLNQMIAPYLMCVLIYNTAALGKLTQESAGRAFAWACVLQSGIALSVNLRIIPSIFPPPDLPADFAAGREYGTTGHPLCLGLLLAAGILMAAYFRSRWLEYAAMVLIAVGIFLTQSRIAFGAALVGFMYLVLFDTRSTGGRLLRLAAIFGGYALLNSTGIVDKLAERVDNDLGSAEARKYAAQFLQANWSDFNLAGVGIELNKLYLQTRGLASSGESAFICYSIGIGIPLTLLYFAVIVWLIGLGIKAAGGVRPANAASLIVLGCIQFFSSIATESSVAMVLWTVIGIALSPPLSKVDASRQAGRVAGREINVSSAAPTGGLALPAAYALPNVSGSKLVMRED